MRAPDDGLPVGPTVPASTRELPALMRHQGRSVSLEPLEAAHAPDLWEACAGADTSWLYLRYGPFGSEEELRGFLGTIAGRREQPFLTVVPASSGRAEGWASFCDMSPANSAIEIGSIWFSPRLQRTRAATEAVFLMLSEAFSLGYHRVAWRCNALNAASRRAALRFGFAYEGTWRGAEIAKGRRRDTAWFSLLEDEWAPREARFRAWLADGNFDADGNALRPLARAAGD